MSRCLLSVLAYGIKESRFLSLAHEGPDVRTKPGRNALEGGQLDVLAAPTFNKAVLGSMHFNVVGEGLLGPILGFTVPPDDSGDSMLQSRTCDSHASTVRQASCKLRHKGIGYVYVADARRILERRKSTCPRNTEEVTLNQTLNSNCI